MPLPEGPYQFGYLAFAYDRDHDLANPHIPQSRDYEAFRAGWLKAETDQHERAANEF